MSHVERRPVRGVFLPLDLLVIAGIARGVEERVIAERLGVALEVVRGSVRHSCWLLGVPGRRHDVLVAAVCAAGLLSWLAPEPRLPVVVPAHLAVIVPLLAVGLSNAEIGRRLWLSLDGVKSRVRSLLRLLGAVDRAHAVALAWGQGLLGS
ncbi:helix-turn-helix transcriptional regulator, partial [Streptomyces sp. MZ04]|uniref:helix-turn-helix transcriptional regulator n=1 Tax=Streptomyces sp. MZ04 TaxID=2559236 RepID=UPI00143311A6